MVDTRQPAGPATRLVIVFVAALAAATATAGTWAGTVRNAEGEPMHGVMVRFTHDGTGVSESVFTDAKGGFEWTGQRNGTLRLRLRTPYYRDLELAVDEGDSKMTLIMEAMTGDGEISDSLPAGYHFGSLPFETGEDALFNRHQFQRDCLTCHQMGNPITRFPRTPEGWVETIRRMHAYLGNFDAELRDRRSVLLSEGFDGKPLAVRPEFPVDESLARTRIIEYRMERGIVPHDAIINPHDGLIYTVDQGADHMAVTDPATGQTEYVSQSGGGMIYRKFGAVAGEIAVFNGRNGPHSLALGPDRKYYVTNTSTNSIGVFDPATRKWEPSFRIENRPGQRRAIYPHTIRFGLDGIVWYTLAGSEQVGNLNPETGETTLVDLPRVKPGGISGGTTPYGIDVDPTTGMVFYTRLFGDKIGRIDPATLEVTEYDSPVRGPRRMRFDADGVLWVTGYSDGDLLRVEPDGFKSKVYPMPEFAPGFRPAPYALGVHPDTGDIWINENMTDRIYRFIPAEERYVVYPVPLSGTYTRDMDFTADGQACTSNNPVPATALEGGVLQVICIDVQPAQEA
ncbi:MAG: carboxypeptidase regulatory-like domain-containing protein [Gammaproteobacteria bacterium]|nr:carboxypeptidase regulatory-like domain-containing protein [Gammaproteobacteria bacterium]